MIAICTNPFRDNNYELAVKAAGLLSDAGYESIICRVFGNDETAPAPEGITLTGLEACADSTLAIVIGGDGTILTVSRLLRSKGVPILGVNLGTLGFMASIEPEQLEYVVCAARGEYHISRRMLLDVSVIRDGVVISSDIALNDAVLHGYGDCITVTARSGDTNITRFAGDGIVISTPTGSTGYSLSAGGPILEPEVDNIIITPICPHVYGARSFVLSPDRVIDVVLKHQHERKAFTSVDGNKTVDFIPGDILRVSKSKYSTLMVRFGTDNFFDVAYDKLT